jgi:hypothetical protein
MERETIYLDGHEAQVLVDKLSQSDELDRELILEVGSIYVELLAKDFSPEITIALNLSTTQLWMLKGACRTTDSVGADKLGARLVAKILQALLNCKNRSGIPTDIPGEGKYSDEYSKDKLEQWRNTIANAGNSDDSAGNQPGAPT